MEPNSPEFYVDPENMRDMYSDHLNRQISYEEMHDRKSLGIGSDPIQFFKQFGDQAQEAFLSLPKKIAKE